MVPEKSGCGPMILMLVAVLFGGVFGISSVSTSGEAGPVAAPVGTSCAVDPQYCVPLAGSDPLYPALETAASRVLDAPSTGAPGVVRYIDENHIPTIGDPAAPVHFVLIMEFSCSHCRSYHANYLPRFINDFVLTGQATFGSVLITSIGHDYSRAGAQAVMCAGEQGALWEMTGAMFELVEEQGLVDGFTPDNLLAAAQALGLDTAKFQECLNASPYTDLFEQNYLFGLDHGMTYVPLLMAKTSGDWSQVERDYDTVKGLVDAAQP